MERIMIYKGVEIKQNEKSGNYYLNSPVNGTQRIFRDIEKAKCYVEHCFVLDSHANGMR